MTAPVSAAVRRTTVAAVLLVALVAAVVSYAHMREVAARAGEAWRAYLLPLSVDGLMVAASMVLLTRRRAGQPGGALAWGALLAGVAASLAANVAAADPSATARLVAAWPAVAFAVAFELLLEQRRPDASEPAQAQPQPVPTEPAPLHDGAAVEPEAPVVAAPPAAPVLPLRAPAAEPSPAVTTAQAAPGDDSDELADRAAALIAASNGSPPGRRVLARQLGCSEHRARTLLDALASNGTSATTKGRGEWR